VPNFVSVTLSIAELACGEKIAYSMNHSITHSPSLFDSPGIEAFASEYDLDLETMTLVLDLAVDILKIYRQ